MILDPQVDAGLAVTIMMSKTVSGDCYSSSTRGGPNDLVDPRRNSLEGECLVSLLNCGKLVDADISGRHNLCLGRQQLQSLEPMGIPVSCD